MTDRDQLNIFHQPADPMPPFDPDEPLEGDVVRVPLTQLTELPGETFEDIFRGAGPDA